MPLEKTIRYITKDLKDSPAVDRLTLLLERAHLKTDEEIKIILLNILVEFIIHRILIEKWNSLDLSKTEQKTLEEVNHHKKLKMLRERSLISDNQFRILSELNKARNNYAHSLYEDDLDIFSPDNSTDIESNQELQDVIDILAEFLEEHSTSFSELSD